MQEKMKEIFSNPEMIQGLHQVFSVGYWQTARVYALAGQYEMAMLMGQKCLTVSEENKLPAFYIGYAYEALARAEIVNKNNAAAEKHLADAQTQLEQVTNKDEKELLKADIDALKKPGEYYRSAQPERFGY